MPKSKEEEEEEETVSDILCEICKLGTNDEKLLLCDACDQGFHIYCLKPPLKRIPGVFS
jgi:hypothetical protein